MMTYCHRTFCWLVCELWADSGWRVRREDYTLFGQSVACVLRLPNGLRAEGPDVVFALIRLCQAFAKAEGLPIRCDELETLGTPRTEAKRAAYHQQAKASAFDGFNPSWFEYDGATFKASTFKQYA